MRSNDDAARRQAVVEGLIAIGIEDGVFHTMAREGQLIELQCETPKCYCDHELGRAYFPRPPLPDSDWDPTVDHYPILKSQGGHKDPWNVRLAHKLCNREDYAWRERITRMIQEHKSLEQMADELNRENVRRPHDDAGPWTPQSFRWSFVKT